MSLEQPVQIKQSNIANQNYQLCKDWKAFAATNDIGPVGAGA